MEKSPRKKRSSKILDPTQPSISGWLSKSPNKSEVKVKTPKSPTRKEMKALENIPHNNNSGDKKKSSKRPEPSPLNIRTKKLDTSSKETSKTSKKPPSKKTLKRCDSASSEELPTFNKKQSRKRQKQTESFKKYGVIIPSVEEILDEQKSFSNYKALVEAAQMLSEPSLKMPCSPKKTIITEERLLDCKHLTLAEITEHFTKNTPFLSDIMTGKKFSDRHKRYHNKNNVRDNYTVRDLTYSTSTIVFSFEQLDHMVLLMQKEFDPEDIQTCYFFKVLVPELCLRIFMEVHDMSKREASVYLENRPI